MQIGLAKKLADYTRIETIPTNTSGDPFFMWSANLLTIRRRKAIICVNDATRFAVILSGIRAADVKKLDQLILDGIRQALISEGIAPEVIKKYLSDASSGRLIAYTKTASRKAVAVLNSVCRDFDCIIEQGADVFSTQRQMQILNRLAFWINKNQIAYPYEHFIERLRDRYGEPVFLTDAVELTVTLELDGSKAVRRLVVPTFYTFEELHKVIQTVFPWEDCHLHRFVLAQDEYGISTDIITPADVESDVEETHHLESEIHLSEVFQTNTWSDDRTILYHYDFGDDWKHMIKLERIIPLYNKNYAQCTLMEGDTPPEDVGGTSGFHYMLDVLKNEKHQDYAEIKAWVSGMRWRPVTEVDLDKVNQRLMKRQYGHFWR